MRVILSICWKNLGIAPYMRILLLLSLQPFFLLGQDFSTTSVNMKQHAIGQTTAITNDADGFVWFGTSFGLKRFDGLNFILFEELNPNGNLPKKNIKHLFRDGQNLWVFYEKKGLYRIDLETYVVSQHREYGSSSSGAFYLKSHRHQNGKIYFPHPEGLAIFEHGQDSLSIIPLKYQGQSLNVRQVIGKDDPYLYVATPDGLFQFDIIAGIVSPLAFPESIRGSIVAMEFDANGAMWISHWYDKNYGLVKYNVEKQIIEDIYGSNESASKFIGSTDIWNLHRDGEKLWIVTNGGGLWMYNTKDTLLTLYQLHSKNQAANGLPQFRYVFADQNKRVWIGSTVNIFYFDPYEKSIELFLHKSHDKNSLVHNSTRLTSPLSNGNIVIGTNAGLSIYNPIKNSYKNVVLPNYNDNTYNNLINTIAEENEHQIWIGTWSGLFLLEHETGAIIERYITFQNAGEDHDPNVKRLRVGAVLSLTKDQQGDLWIANNFGEIRRLTGKAGARLFRYYNNPRDFRNDPVLTQGYLESSVFGLFAISVDGLWQYHEKQDTFFRYKIQHDLADSSFEIYSSYKLNDSIFLLTIDKQLFALQLQQNGGLLKEIQITPTPSFLSDPIKDLNGDLWVITQDGLIKTENSNTGGVLFETNNYLHGRSFNFVEKLNRVSEGKDGRLYYATNDGLLTIDPQQMQFNLNPPEVNIISITSNDQPVNIIPAHKLSALSLSHDQNNVQFSFVAHNDHLPTLTKYSYLLEGASSEWIDLHTENSLSLTGLSPGSYLLKLRATSGDGIKSILSTDVQIEIAPAWYQSNLAYLGYIFLLTGVVFSFYQYQLRQKLIAEEAMRIKELDRFKSRFYTNITHEFRTPLTVISGMSARIKEEPAHWAVKGAVLIQRNSKRLLTLINQMLDLRKLETGHLEAKLIQGDVVNFVNYLVNSYTSLASANHQNLILHAMKESIVMDYDPEILQMIVTNLVTNAIKYSEEPGTISVLIDQMSANNELIVRVSDEGIGINQTDQRAVFDRFYQVKDDITSKSEGTGIGLALTKELVALLHGSISLESTVGEGSSFEVKLPITNDAPIRGQIQDRLKPSRDAEQRAHLTGTQKQQVLVVEDNDDVRDFIVSCLDAKYEVTSAIDGAEGIEKAIHDIPNIILSDVMMPKVNGFELAAELKSDGRTSHIPIIILTAKADIVDRITGLAAGVDAYLAKPFDESELMAQVDNLLEQRRRLFDPSLSKHEGRSNSIAAYDKTEQVYLDKIVGIIEAHLDDRGFKVENLAKELFMSSRQLSRKIKAIAEVTPNQLIRRVRLDRAKSLLVNGNQSVSQISLTVGFSNAQHFATAFKREFGQSPSDFSNSHLEHLKKLKY